LSEDELQDIEHWRQVLETEAYRMAVAHLTSDDLRTLGSLAAKMRNLTRETDRLEYLLLSREFHFSIFRRANSPLLLRLLDYLWDISAPYRAVEEIDHERAYHEHATQVDLLESQDTNELIRAMDEHRSHRLETISKTAAVR